MNSRVFFEEVVARLNMDSRGEAEAVAAWFIEKKYGISRQDLMRGKELSADPSALSDWIERIKAHEPVQYIVGEQYFLGRKYAVNPAVLIPRPETEELAEMLIRLYAAKTPTIADIGTGSGCIAISLALALPQATVIGTDIRTDALQVAQHNAEALKARVQFVRHDILADDVMWPAFDLLVSNPPYISPEEENTLAANVAVYEPHVALFASPSDPLIFYRRLAAVAAAHLNTDGMIAVEINERFGDEVRTIFTESDLQQVEIRQDMSGKDRFALGWKG